MNMHKRAPHLYVGSRSCTFCLNAVAKATLVQRPNLWRESCETRSSAQVRRCPFGPRFSLRRYQRKTIAGCVGARRAPMSRVFSSRLCLSLSLSQGSCAPLGLSASSSEQHQLLWQQQRALRHRCTSWNIVALSSSRSSAQNLGWRQRVWPV